MQRAEEYLREKRPADLDSLHLMGGWALAEAELRDTRSRNPRRRQQRILGAISRLRELMPPYFREVFAKDLDAMEYLGIARLHGDRRTHFAYMVLENNTRKQRQPLSPMALLALAVALGCERPVPTEVGQQRLYEAWKKRHGVIARRLAKPKDSLLEPPTRAAPRI